MGKYQGFTVGDGLRWENHHDNDGLWWFMVIQIFQENQVLQNVAKMV